MPWLSLLNEPNPGYPERKSAVLCNMLGSSTLHRKSQQSQECNWEQERSEYERVITEILFVISTNSRGDSFQWCSLNVWAILSYNNYKQPVSDSKEEVEGGSFSFYVNMFLGSCQVRECPNFKVPSQLCSIFTLFTNSNLLGLIFLSRISMEFRVVTPLE